MGTQIRWSSRATCSRESVHLFDSRSPHRAQPLDDRWPISNFELPPVRPSWRSFATPPAWRFPTPTSHSEPPMCWRSQERRKRSMPRCGCSEARILQIRLPKRWWVPRPALRPMKISWRTDHSPESGTPTESEIVDKREQGSCPHDVDEEIEPVFDGDAASVTHTRGTEHMPCQRKSASQPDPSGDSQHQAGRLPELPTRAGAT